MALPFLCSVVAAGVSPAAVLPAGVAFPVALPMVAAKHVRQENQPARQQILHGLVGAAGDPAVQLDARLGQSCFGAAANAAADEGVHTLGLQKARQAPWPEPLVSTT